MIAWLRQWPDTWLLFGGIFAALMLATLVSETLRWRLHGRIR